MTKFFSYIGKKVTHQLMPERENSDSDFENPPTEEDWENIRIRHLTYTRQNEENRLKKLAKEEKKIEVKAKKAWAAKKREEKRERARIRQEKKITAQEEKEAREQLKVERKELLKQANESRKMAREIRKMAKEKKMARKKSKMAKETKIATANRKMVDEKKKMSIVATKPVVGKKSNKKKLNRKERKNPISKVKYLEKSQTRITKFFKPPRSTVTKPEECPSKPSKS